MGLVLGPAAAHGAQATTFALGAGYPDLRERLSILPFLDGEAKVALADGQQAYSGRLYLRPVDTGALRFVLGGEGGVFRFDGLLGLNGQGSFAEPFGGLELRFGRWMLAADVGPAWIWMDSGGLQSTSVQVTVNTALYYYLF